MPDTINDLLADIETLKKEAFQPMGGQPQGQPMPQGQPQQPMPQPQGQPMPQQGGGQPPVDVSQIPPEIAAEAQAAGIPLEAVAQEMAAMQQGGGQPQGGPQGPAQGAPETQEILGMVSQLGEFVEAMKGENETIKTEFSKMRSELAEQRGRTQLLLDILNKPAQPGR